MPSYSRHLNMDFCSCEASLFFITMILFQYTQWLSATVSIWELFKPQMLPHQDKKYQHVFGVQLKLLDLWWYLGAILSNENSTGDCQVMSRHLFRATQFKFLYQSCSKIKLFSKWALCQQDVKEKSKSSALFITAWLHVPACDVSS